MKIVFRNHELEDLANGIWDYKYPAWIWKKYRAVLYELKKMDSIWEARNYHWWNAERKEWEMYDQFGIRLNKSRRVMFKVKDDELQVLLVRDVNNHYQ